MLPHMHERHQRRLLRNMLSMRAVVHTLNLQSTNDAIIDKHSSSLRTNTWSVSESRPYD